MQQMDLIISADTISAHLAGALGRPLWVLLPFEANWRWMLNWEHAPWYPTARVFQQVRPGDWDGVARSVAERLSGEIALSRSA
jgi:ADP-heptose:LPS heptosyltransferase